MKRAIFWCAAVVALLAAGCGIQFVSDFLWPDSQIFRDYRTLRPGMSIRRFADEFPHEVLLDPDQDWLPKLDNQIAGRFIRGEVDGIWYFGESDFSAFGVRRVQILHGKVYEPDSPAYHGKSLREIYRKPHLEPIRWLDVEDSIVPSDVLRRGRFEDFTGKLSTMDAMRDGLTVWVDFTFKDGRLLKAHHLVNGF